MRGGRVEGTLWLASRPEEAASFAFLPGEESSRGGSRRQWGSGLLFFLFFSGLLCMLPHMPGSGQCISHLLHMLVRVLLIHS